MKRAYSIPLLITAINGAQLKLLNCKTHKDQLANVEHVKKYQGTLTRAMVLARERILSGADSVALETGFPNY